MTPRTLTPHLVIMAAGTGGHVIPGLAVAHEMQKRGWSISWLGTTSGMENQLVPPSGIPLDVVSFKGLRGKNLGNTLRGAWQLLAAFPQCHQILRKRQASAVLGMGGYVCFPGGWMARWLNKPLMLVNADAALLMSNRSLLYAADRVAFGFDGPDARSVSQGVVTGNPVRTEIEALLPPEQRYSGREGSLRLLVVGGSLGAKVLNETVPRALALLQDQRLIITHQTGQAHLASVQAEYQRLGMMERHQVELVPFIDQMAQRLAQCDVMLCRAGAMTVSEICAAGVASILVPLVLSTTSHQRDNAHWLADQAACVHLPQTDLNPEKLAQVLAQCQRDSLCRTAQNARALARPQAAHKVADELEQLLHKKKVAL
jgi:UDP-N-acetylglucosamine--N-acetylmuramyl-(pentapeptide) pyrophosphoryl-undecaprenol N-acetylglucosamine transferase